MSTKTLIVVFFLILLGMMGGIVYMYTQKHVLRPTQSNSMYNSPNPQGDNQDLTQDTQSIDDSMNALDSDLNSVDQGLNDQQTDLQVQ